MKKDFDYKKFREHSPVPIFQRLGDDEEFRIRPEFHRTVKQIMERYVQGVTTFNRDNGSGDVPVNTGNLSPTVSDALLENPYDLNNADLIDRVDAEILAKQAHEAYNSRRRKTVPDDVQTSKVSEETLEA